MGLIKILPEILINKIAAGEVVERPASAVKELIENSIDAVADEIIIDILNGGKKLISISDNGKGMTKEDAVLAFERHATSKIYDEKDLEKIDTLGFRGEALPSIASVSKVNMVTAEKGSSSGTKIEIEGGKITRVSEAGSSPGTLIEIKDLFFNTPARLAFLKTQNTELSHIVGTVESAALAHPEISFTLKHNNRILLSLPKAKDFLERIHQIYSSDIVKNLLEVESEIPMIKDDKICLSGYIAKPVYNRADRSLQTVFVNRRPVRNSVMSHAISEGYHSLIMKDRHPVAFLFLDIDHKEFDVNVHPTKREVRFRNPAFIHDFMARTIRKTLSEKTYHEASQTGMEKGALGVMEALERYMEKSDTPSNEETQMNFDLPLKTKSIHDTVLQAFKTYIIAVDDEGIMIIDQHAAHERIFYEKLNGEVLEIQRLLIPEMIELSQKESLILKDKLNIFRKFGIDIDEFGDNVFVIRSIPAVLKDIDHKRLLLDILDELEKNASRSRMDEIERVRILMACHSAIKANCSLTSEEMTHLIEELKATELPYTCPHGRPTAIRFSLIDLEKLFKRK